MLKNLFRLPAGGPAQPEIRPGDIWRDAQGRKVIIRSVIPSRVYYDCEGVENICSFPRYYFTDEFTPEPVTARSVFIRSREVLQVVKNVFRQKGANNAHTTD